LKFYEETLARTDRKRWIVMSARDIIAILRKLACDWWGKLPVKTRVWYASIFWLISGMVMMLLSLLGFAHK
jgi:hypothetical protein